VALVRGLELIEGTLAENVRVGRYQYTLSDIRDSLQAVGLLDDVNLLPGGLHTQIMSPESPLSHGQVRRLMLARAILGKPRLLIIEDLLDSLDPDTRRQIVDNVFATEQSWTLLVVSHSADVTGRCDRTIDLVSPAMSHVGNGDGGIDDEPASWRH
jgi:putative ABC transport system ATP-binding protein